MAKMIFSCLWIKLTFIVKKIAKSLKPKKPPVWGGSLKFKDILEFVTYCKSKYIIIQAAFTKYSFFFIRHICNIR